MNISDWVKGNLCNGKTAFEFFSWCFTEVYGKPCGSTRVKMHAERFNRTKAVPPEAEYIWRVFEREKANARVLPKNAVN